MTAIDLKQLAKALICLMAMQSANSKPPNIVILLADDMGWNDIGVHGSDISTPNLDALAYNGVVFKRHYAQPSCTPSRAALLTGQYPIRYGLHGYPIQSQYKDGLPIGITIMPEILKGLGYRTHLVGKWHQGYAKWAQMPTRRGFDSFFGFLNGFLSYYDGVHYDPPNIGLDFRCNEEESWRSVYSKYLPEALSEKAAEVIRAHGQNNTDQPFFLLVATNAPHAGGNRLFSEETPPKRSNATQFIKNPTRRVLADVMRYVDDTMGNIVSTLSSSGQLDDTIVIFMGDNGGPSIDHGEPTGYANAASNYPFRGMKFSMFEGGVRAPAILWKSNLKPHVYENMFHITDWLPTLISAAGGQNRTGLDGVDHWAALAGNGTQAPRNELLVEIHQAKDSYGYIKDNFKLVKSYAKNDSVEYSNNYFSPHPDENPNGYPFEDVQNSAVSIALGLALNASACQNLRDRLVIQHSCSTEQDQTTAGSKDCSIEGCLFDINIDPSECFDVSEQNAALKTQLLDKVEEYKAAMVKRYDLPADNRPNERNYYGPSSAVSLNSCYGLITLLVIAAIHGQVESGCDF
ncbi:Arylsulfatase [Nesidiocoris tenuis]|uniref:Arylsulfatase n=1 Tax=Nesidiocoris tenuis TaxID=355587 RepID=A0ABN7AN12_9HEMI|nr:Arylsulfatase [Nesidiocoris tenuis]